MDRAEQVKAHLESGPIEGLLDGVPFTMYPKEFKTGTLGWHCQWKQDRSDTKLQVNLMVSVIGSKPGWVSSAVKRDTGERGPMLPGEQNGTMPERPLAPPETSPLFPNDPEAKKRSRKLS